MEPDTANEAWLQNEPRWRPPALSHGVSTVKENGPAASELRRRCVLLHHGSGPHRTYRIQVCGAMICAEWRLPSDRVATLIAGFRNPRISTTPSPFPSRSPLPIVRHARLLFPDRPHVDAASSRAALAAFHLGLELGRFGIAGIVRHVDQRLVPAGVVQAKGGEVQASPILPSVIGGPGVVADFGRSDDLKPDREQLPNADDHQEGDEAYRPCPTLEALGSMGSAIICLPLPDGKE